MALADAILPVDEIKQRLNSDPEFKVASKFWYCDIRFVIGENQYFMHIEDGAVQSFKHGSNGFDAYTVNISGPTDVWEKMFEPIPKPFYHDWFAASFHHDFEFGGDLESAYAYYYSLRRIKAIMGEAARDAASKLAA